MQYQVSCWYVVRSINMLSRAKSINNNYVIFCSASIPLALPSFVRPSLIFLARCAAVALFPRTLSPDCMYTLVRLVPSHFTKYRSMLTLERLIRSLNEASEAQSRKIQSELKSLALIAWPSVWVQRLRNTTLSLAVGCYLGQTCVAGIYINIHYIVCHIIIDIYKLYFW